jgi:hypothetical protein
MTNQEQVEQQIREVLRTEDQAIPLSNKLFSPEGMFNQMAVTEAERRVVAGSPLFKEAQRRLLELQRKEGSEFARIVYQVAPPHASGAYLLKLEQAETK